MAGPVESGSRRPVVLARKKLKVNLDCSMVILGFMEKAGLTIGLIGLLKHGFVNKD